MKKILQQSMLGMGMLLMVVFTAQAADYAYPVTNPVDATILSTPKDVRAELPEKIRVKQYQTIDVFPDREVPKNLWYNKELRYSVAYQNYRAPVMFLIAGTGAGYDSAKMKMMQRAFFKAGFHVVALSSPTHANFIVAASSTGVPGDLRTDAADLYHVMELLWQRSKQKELISDFYLAGYSLGGTQAAFVANLDEERKVFNFKKVLMINPALNIYDSAVKFDKMLVDNLDGGLGNFNSFYHKLMSNITTSYVEGDFVDLSAGFFESAYKDIIPSEREGKALIGFSFRISLANMFFAADLMTHSGRIVPADVELSRTSSLTKYFKKAARCKNFDKFARNLLYPVVQEQEPDLTFDQLIARSSLRSLESYLRNSEKIGMVTNADDFILADGDIDYLKGVFGDRAKIYPHGGHCGNMAYVDNVAYMVNFFTGK